MSLQWATTDQPDFTGWKVVSERAGAANFALDKLATNETRFIRIPFVAHRPGIRLVSAIVSSTAPDIESANNSASTIAYVGDERPQTLDLTVSDLRFDAVGNQFLAAVSAVGGQSAFGIVTLDSDTLRPRRWYPLNALPEELKVADDGSVVYALFKGRNEVRRLRLDTGITDVSFTVRTSRAVSDWMIPPGRPDLLVVSRQRTDGTPAYLGVSLYQMGIALSQSSTKPAGVIAPTDIPNEFLGGNAEGEDDHFHRFRIGEQGITWLGLTSARFNGHSRNFQRAGNHFVGDQGDVHRLNDGVWVSTVPLAPLGRLFGLVPQTGRLVSASPLALWDIESGRELGQRLLPEFVTPLDRLAVASDGKVLIGSSTEGKLLVFPPSDFAAASLSVRWLAATNNFAPGELLTTTIAVSNAGPSTARGISVPLNFYPTEVAEFVPTGGAVLGTGYNGLPMLSIDALPAGAEAGGVLRLRSAGGQLFALSAEASSQTFQTGTNSWLGDFVLAKPSAAPPFEVFAASFTDVAFDPARNHLWFALPTPHLTLAEFDLRSQTLMGTLPIGFAARRIVISDDGKYLYAVPSSTGAVVRVNLTSRQIDLTIPLDLLQPADFQVYDLAVVPGQSDRLAISLIHAEKFGVIRIFDGASPRTGTYLPHGAEESFGTLGAGSLAFASATSENVRVLERNAGRTEVQIPLRLSAPPLAEVHLSYLTRPNSAGSGSDYIPLRGTLMIGIGETNALLTIETLGDTQFEPDENFDVVWFAADGTQAPNPTRITIINDDLPAAFLTGIPELNGSLTIKVPSETGGTYLLLRSLSLVECGPSFRCRSRRLSGIGSSLCRMKRLWPMWRRVGIGSECVCGGRAAFGARVCDPLRDSQRRGPACARLWVTQASRSAKEGVAVGLTRVGLTRRRS